MSPPHAPPPTPGQATGHSPPPNAPYQAPRKQYSEDTFCIVCVLGWFFGCPGIQRAYLDDWSRCFTIWLWNCIIVGIVCDITDVINRSEIVDLANRGKHAPTWAKKSKLQQLQMQ